MLTNPLAPQVSLPVPKVPTFRSRRAAVLRPRHGDSRDWRSLVALLKQAGLPERATCRRAGHEGSTPAVSVCGFALPISGDFAILVKCIMWVVSLRVVGFVATTQI